MAMVINQFNHKLWGVGKGDVSSVRSNEVDALKGSYRHRRETGGPCGFKMTSLVNEKVFLRML